MPNLVISFVFISALAISVCSCSPTDVANVGVGAQLSPRFLRYSIAEELPADSFVADLRADYSQVAEPGQTLPPLTKIALRVPSPYFRFDQNATSGGGVLRTSRSLDRETICSHRPVVCEVTVDVTIRAVQLFTVIKVVVSVDDINDHAPEFPVSRVQVSVPADAVVGALFPLPAADDADSGRLGAVEYRLLDGGGGDGTSTFQRGNGGALQIFELKITELVDGSHDVRLKLTGRLDQRPSSSSTYQLTVMAIDGGSPPRSASLAVSVAVERSSPIVMPRFDQSVYTARVTENQPRKHAVIQVRAQLYSPDMATLRQALSASIQIVYSLELAERNSGGASASSALPFGIEAQTGLVYVRDNIDYEKERIYRMTVVANYAGGGSRTGGGTLRSSNSATASLVVDVIDANDNQPEITVNALTRSGRAEFPESAMDGTFVAHMAVADFDGAGDNSRTTCSVTGEASSMFRLDQLVSGSRPEYKLVTAGDRLFDRETLDTYRVVVACHDYGTPALTSTVEVTVDVTDENDNDPMFGNEFYVVRIVVPPTPTSNKTVVQLIASDPDTGPNADLRYRLDPVDPLHGNGMLSVDPLTGVISINSSASGDAFQADMVYRYVATVSDCGTPPRTSTASVLVRAVLGGDTATGTGSTQSGHYQFAVDCGRPVGSYVGRVIARDVESLTVGKGQVRFALARPNSWFRVDPTTGEVFLSTNLDDEQTVPERVEMTVQIVDAASSFAVIDSLPVSVEIKCDQLPRFLFPSASNDSVRVNASALAGRDVTVIARPRVQSRPRQRVRFAIISGNTDGAFAIDSVTGFVSLISTAFSARRRSRYRLSLSVVGSEEDQSETDAVANLHVVIVGGKRAEKEIAWEGGADYEVVETASDNRALMGALFDDWNVIVVGMACGAGLLVIVILIAVFIIVRRKKRSVSKHATKYNCRIEAANKSRQHGDDNGTDGADDGGITSEFCSLRRTPDSGMEDVSCSVIEDNGVHKLRPCRATTSTPIDHRLSGTTSVRALHSSQDLDVVDEGDQLGSPVVWALAATPSSASVNSPLQQPPSILKSSIKKEVKFCLDVSDDEGLHRPLNVVYHKASPTAFDAVHYKPMSTTTGSCPTIRLPPRPVLATDDDDDDVEGGSVGSGGSVTDSGRGASEEGDSGSATAHGPPVAAYSMDVNGGNDIRRHRPTAGKELEVVRPRQGHAAVLSTVRNDDVTASQSSLSQNQPPPHHFRNPGGVTVAGGGRAVHLAPPPPPPPMLSTFRSDSAILSQCALSLADDVPAATAASTAAAAAVHAATGYGSWSNDVSHNGRKLTSPGLETAVSPATAVGAPTSYQRGGVGSASSRLPSSSRGTGLQVVNGHLLTTTSSERVADV